MEEEENKKTMLENFFEDEEIRILRDKSKHWVCLSDMLKIIKLAENSNLVQQIIKKYEGSQKTISHTDAENHTEKYIYICKRAAYEILFRSNKKEAEEFRDFVFELLGDLEENYAHLLEDAIKKHKERDVYRLSTDFVNKNEEPYICLCKSKDENNQHYYISSRQEKSISTISHDYDVLKKYKLGNAISQKNKFKEMLKQNNIIFKGSKIFSSQIEDEAQLINIFKECYKNRLE